MASTALGIPPKRTTLEVALRQVAAWNTETTILTKKKTVRKKSVAVIIHLVWSRFPSLQMVSLQKGKNKNDPQIISKM